MRLRSELDKMEALVRPPTQTTNDLEGRDSIHTRMLGNKSSEALAQSICSQGSIATNEMPQVDGLGPAPAIGNASPVLERPNYHRSRQSNLSWDSGSGQSSSFVDDRCRRTSTSPISTSMSPMGRSNSFPSLSDNTDATFEPPQGFRRPEARLFPPSLPIQKCISVVRDEHLINYLMGIFSDNNSLSLLPSISPAHFIRVVCESAQDIHTLCLVNAVLAWAYKLLRPRFPRQPPMSYTNAFLKESKRLVDFGQREAVGIPLIQSLSILALVDMAEGNDEEAWIQAEGAARLSAMLYLSDKDTTPHTTDESRSTQALTFCSQITLFRYVEPQDPQPFFFLPLPVSHRPSRSRMLRLLTGRLEPNINPLYMRFGQEGADIAIKRGPSSQFYRSSQNIDSSQASSCIKGFRTS